ncbi:MAG TPA: class I SAM-dependent methyltransferase [Micromonosporaceae bacterium]|nr:class I SAM-dependent methyltransferase [Micromonosporaceae bacterium]
MIDATNLRRAVARTPLARMAAFPKRFSRVARHDARVVGTSVKWLFTSREHHNYTYDLTTRNHTHLAWFVSHVCGIPVTQVRHFLTEINEDEALRQHVVATTEVAARGGLADRTARYARRIGWYAVVRARKPKHVVETGVDKGLGSLVIAAALLRNATEGHPGRVTSIDINPEAGYLVKALPWSTVVDLVISDSQQAIGELDRPVDVFLHDSDHAPERERAEFEKVEQKLAPGALLLTDNVTATDVLANYAEATERRFLAWTERPRRHWYPGDGIGVAW